MYCRKGFLITGSFCARILVLLVAFSVVSASAQDSGSEEHMVFPNQYVIEPAISMLTLSESAISNSYVKHGVALLEDLGGDAHLVGPNISGLTDSSISIDPVPYDPKDDFCVTLIKQGIARSCSPNYEVTTQAVPNDALYSTLWGMTAENGINGPAAWDLSTGSDSIVVAVVDTGIDYNHPDLKDNMWVNTAEIPGNGVDDDNNGYIDDIYGMNAINSSGDPLDDNGHGTHCAGTIGGRGNNGVGVAGVNWNVKLMGLKFLSASGSGSLAGAIQAINYMVLMKNRGVNVRVSSNSWGGGGYNAVLANAIEAADEAGIIFVAAAGNAANDNDATPTYPANYDFPNVVSVAALDSSQNLATFSNYGATTVDIGAPGVSINSTYKGGGYRSLSGTSMATPHVSGALALLVAYDSELTNAQLIQRLYDSGVNLATLSGVVRTGRKLNVARMLSNNTDPLPPPAPEPTPCEYSVSQVSYSPPTDADNEAIVLQADEFNYYTVDLPFQFNFHRRAVTSLVISPNGVVYTKTAPTGMDYQNASTAPSDSIAALHADLVARSNPQGVRVKVNSGSVVIYWRMKVYGYEQNGDVEVRLKLHKDGLIETFTSISDETVEGYLQSRATIGLKGSTNNSATTFAHNSSQVRDELGVSFARSCSDDDSDSGTTVSGITAKGIRGTGGRNDFVRAGGRITADVTGSGSGSVNVYLGFQGKMCPNPFSVNLTNGRGSSTFKLGKKIRKYKNVTLTSGAVKQRIKIKTRKGRLRNGKTSKVKKISTKRLLRRCENIAQQ